MRQSETGVPAAGTVRLFRVIVPVEDIDRAAAFYAELLGAAGARVSPGRHYFDRGGVVLALYGPRADGDARGARPNPEPVYFAVADLDAVYRRAEQLGGLSATAICRWAAARSDRGASGRSPCPIRSGTRSASSTGPRASVEPEGPAPGNMPRSAARPAPRRVPTVPRRALGAGRAAACRGRVAAASSTGLRHVPASRPR